MHFGAPGRSDWGLTYIELMVAVALIGIALVPMFGLFLSGFDSNANALYVSTATFLASEKLEELRHAGFEAVLGEPLVEVEGYAGYQREVVVTDRDYNLKEVQVTVYWNRPRNRSAVRLVTLIARK